MNFQTMGVKNACVPGRPFGYSVSDHVRWPHLWVSPRAKGKTHQEIVKACPTMCVCLCSGASDATTTRRRRRRRRRTTTTTTRIWTNKAFRTPLDEQSYAEPLDSSDDGDGDCHQGRRKSDEDLDAFAAPVGGSLREWIEWTRKR